MQNASINTRTQGAFINAGAGGKVQLTGHVNGITKAGVGSISTGLLSMEVKSETFGTIGTSSEPIETQVDTIAIALAGNRGTSACSACIHQFGNIGLNESSVGGLFSLRVEPLSIDKPGNITNGSSGPVAALAFDLHTSSGSIGLSSPLQLGADAVHFTAPNGSVSLLLAKENRPDSATQFNNTAIGSLPGNAFPPGFSLARDNISIKASEVLLLVNHIKSTNGSVSISGTGSTSTGGTDQTITVAPRASQVATVLAGAGSITIQSTGNVIFEQGSGVMAQGGSVHIFAAGAAGDQQTLTEAPPIGFQPNAINGGKVYFGAGGIKLPENSATVTVTADGLISPIQPREVILDAANSPGSLELRDNVRIEALPIAFVENKIAGILHFKVARGPRCLLTVHDKFSGSLTNQGAIHSKGSCIALATDNNVIITPLCMMNLPKSSIVAIEGDRTRIRIKNLGFTTVGVKVSNETVLSISPGCELDIADTSFGLSQATDAVARRRPELFKVENLEIKISEFSPLTALASNSILKAICKSNLSLHKQMKQTILKSAAALSIVTANHGPFGN